MIMACWLIIIVILLYVSRSVETATYSKCGFSNDIRHYTWYEHLFTNSPVLFPTNDEELCDIVSTAQKEGCKVRVRGAGHSEDGIVMQKLDELSYDVVVINLKDYTPSQEASDGSTAQEWNGVLGTDSVKVPTGWSTLELMGTIRPRGYLTRTNTAGRLFSVGGAYLNPSVHGNVMDESRYSAQIRSVRAMQADCRVKVYSEEDVTDWRGSVGLLGVVTAVEIEVVKDTGLTMTRSSLSTESFDMEQVRAWIEDEYRNNDGVEFFYWVYEDILDAYEVDYNGGEPLDAAPTQAYYDDEILKNSDLSYVGGNPTGMAQLTELLGQLIGSDRNLAKLFQSLGRDGQNQFFDDASQMPRDGYFVPTDQVPNFSGTSLFVPCAKDCVDESAKLLEVSRDYLKQIVDDSTGSWYPNLPLEWRVFTVQPNEMTLEHLLPGKYVSIELMALQSGMDDGLAPSRYLSSLQSKWLELYPTSAIHHAKGYGYENIPGYGTSEDEVPYQNDEILNSVYNKTVREAFVGKMREYDPQGTFAAGSFLRLLDMTGNKFTPKQYVGDSCFDFGDADCIDGCCDKTFFSTINNVCLAAASKGLNEECQESCECSSGLSCQTGSRIQEWFVDACRP